MALPAALAPVAARVGQVAIAAAPTVWEKTKAYLSKATSKDLPTPQDAAAYAGTSKNALALLIKALASGGVSPDQLVPGIPVDEIRDREIAALLTDLKSTFAAAYGTVDSASVHYQGDPLLTIVGAISSVRRVMPGLIGDESIRRFHAGLRILMATSSHDLEAALFKVSQVRGLV